MLFDVSQMRSTHDRVERQLPPGAFADQAEDYEVVEPVLLEFDVHKNGDQYRLVGHALTVLKLSCSRCLEPFFKPFDAAFDLLYVPHRENTGEGEVEIQEDDLTTAFYRDHVIDLGQLLREQFFLALPMKPLCSEQCKGLCPQCGTNLNGETCDCSQRWEDPRLAGLKALLRNESNDA